MAETRAVFAETEWRPEGAMVGGGGRSQERTILRSEFPDSRGSRFLDALKGENADFAQKFPDPRTANHCNHGFLPRGSPAKSEQKALNRKSIAFPWLAHFLHPLKGENADFAQKFPDPRTANHCNHGLFARDRQFSPPTREIKSGNCEGHQTLSGVHGGRSFSAPYWPKNAIP
jgi:hypothetical protein